MSIINSDEVVWTHSIAARPVVLLEALYKHAKTKKYHINATAHLASPAPFLRKR